MELDLNRAALVIIDMQNGGCKPGGSLIEMIGVKELRSNNVYKPINQLRDWAYENNVPVIYIVTEFEADFSNAGLTGERFPIQQFNHFAKDSWDSEIVEELKMNEKDLLVKKVKWSGFFETELEELLNELGRDQLILTGGATDVCVQETATDAFYRNIECFVPKEATYSFTKEDEDTGFKQLSFGRSTLTDVETIIKNRVV